MARSSLLATGKQSRAKDITPAPVRRILGGAIFILCRDWSYSVANLRPGRGVQKIILSPLLLPPAFLSLIPASESLCPAMDMQQQVNL